MRVKTALAEAEARLKHSEASAISLKEQFLHAQKQVTELEYENEKMQRTISNQVEFYDKLQAKICNSLQEQVLGKLRTENKELTDEYDSLRFKETQLKKNLRNLTEQSALNSDREKAALKSKEKELELAKKRIDIYVSQLTEFESLSTKVASLEQMLDNARAQRKELNEEIQAALTRANNARSFFIAMECIFALL